LPGGANEVPRGGNAPICPPPDYGPECHAMFYIIIVITPKMHLKIVFDVFLCHSKQTELNFKHFVFLQSESASMDTTKERSFFQA